MKVHPFSFIGGLIKPALPKTLFGRSLLIIITPLIFVQAISAYAFFNSHWSVVTKNLSTLMTREISLALDYFETDTGDSEQRIEYLSKTLQLEFTFFPQQILDSNAASAQKFQFFIGNLRRNLDEQIERPYLIDTESFSNQIIIQIQLASGVIQTVIPRERIFSGTVYSFMIWMVGSSLIIFIVAWAFMRNQIRPIQNLARVADRFGREQNIYHDPEETLVSLKIRGATEIRRVALAFNRMSERLFRQMRQRTDMLSGVSHDLRTPLTRMKLQLEMMSQDRDVKSLQQDIQDMEHMIKGYLDFAKGEIGEAIQNIDFKELLKDAEKNARRAGFPIHCHIESNFSVLGRPNALQRCLNNLVSNAGIHGYKIWLQGGKRGDNVEIVIDDDGPGIPEEKREDVFRPFFRLDNSRNPSTGSTGLGLSIARDIARIHGGDITLDQSPQGGVRAKLMLPL